MRYSPGCNLPSQDAALTRSIKHRVGEEYSAGWLQQLQPLPSSASLLERQRVEKKWMTSYWGGNKGAEEGIYGHSSFKTSHHI